MRISLIEGFSWIFRFCTNIKRILMFYSWQFSCQSLKRSFLIGYIFIVCRSLISGKSKGTFFPYFVFFISQRENREYVFLTNLMQHISNSNLLKDSFGGKNFSNDDDVKSYIFNFLLIKTRSFMNVGLWCC